MKAQLTAVVRSLDGVLYLPYSVVIVDCMDIGVASRSQRGQPSVASTKQSLLAMVCGLWSVGD